MVNLLHRVIGHMLQIVALSHSFSSLLSVNINSVFSLSISSCYSWYAFFIPISFLPSLHLVFFLHCISCNFVLFLLYIMSCFFVKCCLLHWIAHLLYLMQHRKMTSFSSLSISYFCVISSLHPCIHYPFFFFLSWQPQHTTYLTIMNSPAIR